MITVSNSSPLIFLAKLGCFNFLKMLFQKISIPNEVYVDIAVKGKGRPGDKEINSAIKESWLEVIEIKENDAIEKSMREWKIHRGEAEAIFLAQKLADARLLTDDDMAVIKGRV